MQGSVMDCIYRTKWDVIFLVQIDRWLDTSKKNTKVLKEKLLRVVFNHISTLVINRIPIDIYTNCFDLAATWLVLTNLIPIGLSYVN